MVANEQRAYTLSDRGTWLSMREKVPGLALLFGGRSIADNRDAALRNRYGVMAVNPETHPGVNVEVAPDVRAVARLGRDAARDRQVRREASSASRSSTLTPRRTGRRGGADNPVSDLLTEFQRPELLQIVALTLRVTGAALALATLAGVPLGALLGLVRFRGLRADHARALHRHGAAAGRRRPLRLHAAVAQRPARGARLAVHAGRDDRGAGGHRLSARGRTDDERGGGRGPSRCASRCSRSAPRAGRSSGRCSRKRASASPRPSSRPSAASSPRWAR